MPVVVAAVMVLAMGAMTVLADRAEAVKPPTTPPPRVVVYVESQGLCYESIVTAQNLPPHGPFRTLAPDLDETCGEDSLITEFGPGDQGYVGGRWILPDGRRFMCPLIGGGYLPPA